MSDTVPFKFIIPRHTYELSGPAGPGLDQAVAFAVQIGIGVEPIKPGTNYRLNTFTQEQIDKVAERLAVYGQSDTITLKHEQAPQKISLLFVRAPERPPVRQALIHGSQDVERLVCTAIDAGLALAPIGLSRYAATGPTRQHVAWLMALFQKPLADVLQLMGLTPEAAAAEDAGSVPSVYVALPTREVTSVIERDGQGDIRTVTQTERTVD